MGTLRQFWWIVDSSFWVSFCVFFYAVIKDAGNFDPWTYSPGVTCSVDRKGDKEGMFRDVLTFKTEEPQSLQVILKTLEKLERFYVCDFKELEIPIFCCFLQSTIRNEGHAHNSVPGCAQPKRDGAQTRIRTTDTRIFSPLLYQLSYLGVSRIIREMCAVITSKFSLSSHQKKNNQFSMR